MNENKIKKLPIFFGFTFIYFVVPILVTITVFTFSIAIFPHRSDSAFILVPKGGEVFIAEMFMAGIAVFYYFAPVFSVIPLGLSLISTLVVAKLFERRIDDLNFRKYQRNVFLRFGTAVGVIFLLLDLIPLTIALLSIKLGLRF